MILAPLRGVTVRRFRLTFGGIARECGFTEAVTPFIPAMCGLDPLKDAELAGGGAKEPLETVPQFIGKDPSELRRCAARVREAGYAHADLNCGCPFPMVVKKGRGGGLLRSPDALAKMLEAGCEAFGPGAFSAKTRLGVESPRELLRLMPVFNAFPLRRLAVHARTVKQMYSGECDLDAFREAAAVAKMPVVYNGDVDLAVGPGGIAARLPSGRAEGWPLVMCGRAFVRFLGARSDSPGLLDGYIRDSLAEGASPGAVLGRMKELLSYWAALPAWAEVWSKAKKARSLDSFCEVVFAKA